MTAQPVGVAYVPVPGAPLRVPGAPQFRVLAPPEVGKCAWCRVSLVESVSDDFCGDTCQGAWHRNNVGTFDGVYY